MSESHSHGVDMGEFQHTLTKKAGPLPVWAWGLGIGAVLVIFLWMHNRDSATGPVTAYDDTATMDGLDSNLSDSNQYDDAYQSGFSAGSGASGSGGADDPIFDATGANPDGTASGTHPNGPRNNKSWLRQAAAYLVGSGIANPIRSSNILNKYLRGEPLTKKQRHVVNQAIRGTGAPPSAPQHVSNTNHHQQATGGAHGDHNVNPHTSNAQPHHGSGQGQGHPPKPRPKPHQHAGTGR